MVNHHCFDAVYTYTKYIPRYTVYHLYLHNLVEEIKLFIIG